MRPLSRGGLTSVSPYGPYLAAARGSGGITGRRPDVCRGGQLCRCGVPPLTSCPSVWLGGGRPSVWPSVAAVNGCPGAVGGPRRRRRAPAGWSSRADVTGAAEAGRRRRAPLRPYGRRPERPPEKGPQTCTYTRQFHILENNSLQLAMTPPVMAPGRQTASLQIKPCPSLSGPRACMAPAQMSGPVSSFISSPSWSYNRILIDEMGHPVIGPGFSLPLRPRRVPDRDLPACCDFFEHTYSANVPLEHQCTFAALHHLFYHRTNIRNKDLCTMTMYYE